MDDELEELIRERLFQAAVVLVGLLLACAALGGGVWRALPTLRGLPGAAKAAVMRLPDVVRTAARTAGEATTTAVAAAEDGWRASGEQ